MRQPLGDYDDGTEEFELVGDERSGDDYTQQDRRLPRMLLSLTVMALFAGGLWFAYHLGARHSAATASGGGVPLIRADQQPDKVKPDQPGGMKIPDQNVSIFDEKPGVAPVEKLLPPPEKPMPRPEPAPQQAAAPPNPAPAPSVPALPSSSPIPAPTTPPAPPAPAATREALPAGRPTAAAVSRSTAEYPARMGPVQVRLAAVRTPEAARVEWARLKRENADLLGRLSAVAVRTDLGDKGIYYRIEAGPFDNAAAAERLCDALKRRNLGCILAR